MNLLQTLAAAGMTPPAHISPERWMRFPGIGKGKANRAGWCRVISPTLAIYGDFSSGLSATWRDEAHRDSADTARLLAQAPAREREFAEAQRERQAQAAARAEEMIRDAYPSTHAYLRRKGFPQQLGLVSGENLLVPVRDVAEYRQTISVQAIAPDGEKRFVTGSRTRGGIYRIGAPIQHARKIVLCEGYATGLSLDAALERLPGPHSVLVCFSAWNLALIAESFPKGLICADHDESKTGEHAARKTGLRWIMPPEVGTDFNDLHQRQGLSAVIEMLRMPP